VTWEDAEAAELRSHSPAPLTSQDCTADAAVVQQGLGAFVLVTAEGGPLRVVSRSGHQVYSLFGWCPPPSMTGVSEGDGGFYSFEPLVYLFQLLGCRYVRIGWRLV
jgi:hypothetical protein